MTTPDDDAAYRSEYDPPAETVTLREAEEMDSSEGMMEVRLPIASTGAVRNEGDDPLSASELHGMAQQVDTLTTGVFPEHGGSSVVDGTGRYSQFEKLGYWADADLQSDAAADGEDLLMATARMPDPETLPPATGDYREALAILKEQAKRGIPISASIGWRDDGDSPGGVDLLETSIVGIGADPRTNTEGGTEALARAAVDAGADPEEFVAEVRNIVRETTASEARPFGPPGGSDDEWEDFEACVADVEDWENIDDPEAFCAWAEEQASADTDTQDMTDDDTPEENAGDTTDDGEQTDRAPDDVTPTDLATLVAASYDGVEADALVDAWDDMGDYVGGVDLDALTNLVATATGADADAASDAMESLMGDGEEQEGDKPDGEDDEGEEERDADGDGEENDDLREMVKENQETLEAIRAGELDLDRPGDDGEAEEERDADGGESDTDEQDAATDGPDWRA